NEVVHTIVEKIKQWEMPVMVHESLRKLAEISHVPEAALGIGQISLPDLFIKKSASISIQEIDPHRILEGDFIRWLIFASAQYPLIIQIAKANITSSHLCIPGAIKLYESFLKEVNERQICDLIALGSCMETEEDQKL